MIKKHSSLKELQKFWINDIMNLVVYLINNL